MGLIIAGGGSSTPADGSITLAKLAANSVDSSKIVDGAVAAADIAAGAITREKMSATNRTGGWAPTGAIAQTMGRDARMQDTITLSNGTLFLQGGIVIPANVTVTSITWVSSTTAGVGLTHQWFCLVDQNLNVLKKTVDDTSTAWAASAAKTLALSSTYTPSVDTPVYLGIVQTASTTLATLRGCVSTATGPISIAPIFCGSSTSSLTDPASLGGTAGAITAGGTVGWAWIS